MKQTFTSRNSQSTPLEVLKDEDRSKFLTQLEIPFLMFILKKFSDKDAPLSANKIVQYMNHLTGEEHSEKTLLRKLRNLCLLQNDSKDELINNTLFLTFGGCVVATTNEKSNPHAKRVQSRYYFKPLLDAGDLAMICGAIASNRYLTQQEKAYLLSREQTLSAAEQIPEDCAQAFSDPSAFPALLSDKPKDEKVPASQASNLLQHVNQLYDAIENGYQISLIYGIYDMDRQRTRHIRFRARNEANPYTLNPYALLWNGGAYYLLATHNGHDNPVHFRVDRIVSIKPVPQKNDATQKEPRAALPESLKPYFTLRVGQPPLFLPEKYTAVYPLMGIYDEEDFTSCLIECTADTLSILIDTFGNKLSILPSPLPHGEDEVNFHGKPQQFFAVQIRQVQYDNVRQFCLQQHTSITALRPPKLVEDIRAQLGASLRKYQAVQENPEPGSPT